jgi:hypothetical protein
MQCSQAHKESDLQYRIVWIILHHKQPKQATHINSTVGGAMFHGHIFDGQEVQYYESI